MSPGAEQRWSIAAELGAELKTARTSARRTYEDVKQALLGSKERIWRLETGKGPYKWDHIQALCGFYNVPPQHAALLVEMAKATMANDSTWVESNPARFGLMVLLERRALGIETYSGDLIHGLLQTEEHHRAMLKAWPLATPEAEAEQIRVRQARQQEFFARPDVRLTVIMTQAALEHRVGTRKVMTEQLNRLQERAGRDGVTIRYIPNTSPPHGGLRGAFTLVTTDLGTSAYIEHIDGGRVLSDPHLVTGFTDAASSALAVSRDIREWQ